MSDTETDTEFETPTYENISTTEPPEQNTPTNVSGTPHRYQTRSRGTPSTSHLTEAETPSRYRTRLRSRQAQSAPPPAFFLPNPGTDFLNTPKTPTSQSVPRARRITREFPKEQPGASNKVQEEFRDFEVPIPGLSDASSNEPSNRGPSATGAQDDATAQTSAHSSDSSEVIIPEIRDPHATGDDQSVSTQESLPDDYEFFRIPYFQQLDLGALNFDSQSASPISEPRGDDFTFHTTFDWDNTVAWTPAMGTRAHTDIFDIYGGDNNIITADEHAANLIRYRQRVLDKKLPVSQVNLYAQIIERAVQAKTPVGAHAFTQLNANFENYLTIYGEIIVLLEALRTYFHQTRGTDKKYFDEVDAWTAQNELEYKTVGEAFARCLLVADVPAGGMTPLECHKMIKDSMLKNHPGAVDPNAPSLLPAPHQTVLLDRNMANIIKTKPLTDQAKPSEIQTWCESIISIYQLQQMDRLNVQLAHVFMKSHLEPSLCAVLSCFLENKPLFIDAKEIGRAHV